MNGWFLLVFVVLVSGLLSYYGDVIGRKMGKKRLKVGRLRPRHTAAIMTALFGMFGAALAIGALLVVSEPVRAMLFEGDKVRADFDKINIDLKQTKGDLAQNRGELERTKGLVKTEQSRVRTEQGKLQLAQRDVSELRASANSLKAQAQVIKVQLSKVRSQVASLKKASESLKASNASLDTKRSYAEARYNETITQNLKLEKEMRDKEKEAKERIGLLQQKIEDLGKSFTELQEEYARQASQHKDDIKALSVEVEAARRSLNEAQQELNATRADLQKTATVYRTQPLIFSKDDELGRVAVRTRLNAAEARSFLLALIDKAAVLAKANGARPSSTNGSEAILPEGFDSQQRPISSEAQLQSLVKRLSNVEVEQVVLASAIFNSFRGEPVGLKITILPNPIVYKRDTIIAETRIDGQLPQDQIVQAISKFVEEQVGPKAVKDGMIPAIGQPNPLGEINQEDLFKLIADIKSRPFMSRVKFVAAQETRAGDKLKLEIKVS